MCFEGLNGTGEIFNILPDEDAGSRSDDWNVALLLLIMATPIAAISIKKFHAVILHNLL
ncbi:MAG: hypothetical protein IPO24_20785 [Bacteroidetes bacterium]|nr:hypothetical protein [Bacteroidota bacterium]